MKPNNILDFCVGKVTNDKYLQNYLLKYCKTFNAEDLLLDVQTHAKYSDSIKVISKKYKGFLDVFPLIECNLNHIDKKKLDLVRKNIDAFALDINRFFIPNGVIRVNNGTKDVKEIVFSTRDTSLMTVIKHLDLNMYSAILVDLVDNKAKIYSYMGAEEYLERAKVSIVPIPLHKMSEQRGLESLALVFYINQLATGIKKVKSSSKPNKGTQTKNANTKKAPRQVVNLPRVVYTINEKGKLTRKGDITRHTDAWLVSGHWRRYKSGKEVWINSFTKGEGEIANKIYRV